MMRAVKYAPIIAALTSAFAARMIFAAEPVAPTSGALPPYQPLEPLTPELVGKGADLGSYLNAAFTLSITLGALFAVIMFTVGGVIYMTSDSIGKKSDSVARMKSAVWGLLLLIGAALILRTINPCLLDLGFFVQGPRSAECENVLKLK